MITGDAVVLELLLARLASRAVALAIDVAVMVMAFGLVLALAAVTGALSTDDVALAKYTQIERINHDQGPVAGEVGARTAGGSR